MLCGIQGFLVDWPKAFPVMQLPHFLECSFSSFLSKHLNAFLKAVGDNTLSGMCHLEGLHHAIINLAHDHGQNLSFFSSAFHACFWVWMQILHLCKRLAPEGWLQLA